MGFYSFYRIIKDIIRTLFGNNAFRLFLVGLFLFFLLVCLSNLSFASDLRPWNVYTNTTEFNWNKLTNINYTDNQTSLSYSFYNLSSERTYYLYNPNSSTGSIRLYTYVSNDDNTLLMLYEDTSHTTSYWFDFQYKYNGGYCDLPFNTLFTPQFDCSISFGNNNSLELYMLDDKYSNIETYNEISALSVDIRNFLYGDDVSSPVSSSSVDNLVASYNGTFINTNLYNTLYFPIKKGYRYNLSWTNPSSTSEFPRFGYTSSVPSSGLSYDSFFTWQDINYSSTYSFVAPNDTYFYISYSSLFSNFSIMSNYNSVSEGGINQQLINQGDETRETLTDSSISQDTSDYSLPTDGTNDITQDGFSSIFDRIRTTFTNGSSTPATINVPFTNKSFTISKSSVFGSANLGIVQTIIEAFWWFVVSVFIVKDIFIKIEKIKTGNIEFTETTNIKEDIL